MRCIICGADLSDEALFCIKCGIAVEPKNSEFMIVTTPTIPGYCIKKVLGVVTGLTPRTRGVLGKFVAGVESILGGEVTAFTSELEKARIEAIQRVKMKAFDIGANAIVGLDLETSDVGIQLGIVVISATGTAVIVEKE